MNTIKTVSVALLLASALVAMAGGDGQREGGGAEKTHDNAGKTSLNAPKNQPQGSRQDDTQQRYVVVTHPARYAVTPGQSASGQGYATRPDRDRQTHPTLSRQGAMFATVILLLSGK